MVVLTSAVNESGTEELPYPDFSQLPFPDKSEWDIWKFLCDDIEVVVIPVPPGETPKLNDCWPVINDYKPPPINFSELPFPDKSEWDVWKYLYDANVTIEPSEIILIPP
jgi:hypothetical protein